VRAHFIFNAFWEPLDFELPPRVSDSGGWRRWIDTFLASPQDIVYWHDAPEVGASTYRAGPRSVVVVWAPV
jgi:glycogen operon protein